MKIIISIDKKGEELEKYIKSIEKDLSMSLSAIKEDDEVNGYINTKQENGKTIVEVCLYEKDEPANYFEGVYRNRPYNYGHKTSFKAVPNSVKEKIAVKSNGIM